MSAATVEQRLRDVKRAEAEVRSTPCANCGHAFERHDTGFRPRCVFPLRPIAGQKNCRCRAFVDPVCKGATQ